IVPVSWTCPGRGSSTLLSFEAKRPTRLSPCMASSTSFTDRAIPTVSGMTEKGNATESRSGRIGSSRGTLTDCSLLFGLKKLAMSVRYAREANSQNLPKRPVPGCRFDGKNRVAPSLRHGLLSVHGNSRRRYAPGALRDLGKLVHLHPLPRSDHRSRRDRGCPNAHRGGGARPPFPAHPIQARLEEELDAFPGDRSPELGDPIRALFGRRAGAARRHGGD